MSVGEPHSFVNDAAIEIHIGVELALDKEFVA